MGMIGIDPEETADYLDEKAEFAAAELLRDLAKRNAELEKRVTELEELAAKTCGTCTALYVGNTCPQCEYLAKGGA